MPEVIVVGAGVGGLAAAIRLAVAGCHVEIYERNARVGGKLNLVEVDGWRFDSGPSLLTMPDVARDLFAIAGASMDEMIDLQPLDPSCRYYYPDGIVFDAPRDAMAMATAIEDFSFRDAEGFRRFIDYGRRVYAATAQPFLYSPRPNLATLSRQVFQQLDTPMDIARVLSPFTLDALVRENFRDPHLRQMFDRYATYNGSSPFRCPAVYSIIPFIEYEFGVWYPRGGMYRLAEALAEVARRVGVIIHTESPVIEICCSGDRVTGVELIDGTRIAAPIVISNVDIATTYRHMLTKSPRIKRRIERLDRIEPSLSSFVLLLGTDCHFEQLQHHNIFFSNNYAEEFRDIFKHLVAPRDPTIYVCATSRSDPAQAPPGHENLFVQVNVPYLSSAFDWSAERSAYRNLIIDKLEAMALEKLGDHIVYEQMITPEDMQSYYGAPRGAIYGFSSNSLLAPFQRPQNRARDVKGLYFVGGSVHPGGGLPLVMLSGKIVAHLVSADLDL